MENTVDKLEERAAELKSKLKIVKDTISGIQANCNHAWEWIGNTHNDDVEKCVDCNLTRKI